METSVVTVKGQIVVPVKIRRKFGIKKGTQLCAFVEQNGKLMIQPLDKSYFESLAGIGTEGKMLKSLMDDKKKEREL